MLPSHFSVADFGVFAVALVLGLIVVLLFMFDFVSNTFPKGVMIYKFVVLYTEVTEIDKRHSTIKQRSAWGWNFMGLSNALVFKGQLGGWG